MQPPESVLPPQSELSALGHELVLTTPAQRRVALARPLSGLLTLFLELTYHLEHHLYPQVPSHNLAELSRRLDPYFEQAGVEPRRVF